MTYITISQTLLTPLKLPTLYIELFLWDTDIALTFRPCAMTPGNGNPQSCFHFSFFNFIFQCWLQITDAKLLTDLILFCFWKWTFLPMWFHYLNEHMSALCTVKLCYKFRFYWYLNINVISSQHQVDTLLLSLENSVKSFTITMLNIVHTKHQLQYSTDKK